MKKIIILIFALILVQNLSLAEVKNTSLNLYCNNTGADKCKYEFFVKNALLANNLKLDTAQKKQLEEIFKKHADNKSNIENSLIIAKEQLCELKKEKASLKTKSEKRSEIRKLNKELKHIDKAIEKDIKKILTRKQRGQYRDFENIIF